MMSISIPEHPMSPDDIHTRYMALKKEISAAASDYGRSDGPDIQLLAVSKTFDIEIIKLAVAAGIKEFGENRPLEMASKAQALPGLQWNIIGPVQRNKAREVAQYATRLHSLDSVRLAQALNKRLLHFDRHLDVLIQVNTSGEESKSGIHPSDAEAIMADIAPLERLHIRGLMTIAPYSPSEQVVRGAFERLRLLRDRLLCVIPDGVELKELSMGMSSDFRWAIAEGSTIVRLGTAIFGHRPTSVYS
ncbi:YggS family pyridoxal phosphate-dependent enzyme [Corynebacterium sp. ES2794-CONJ1]|uniref:YggS family pyridoxal phosphate-dependent enzyme n=1 Tax=unclassified Corynebacterium TaxID=2624378 RepID=UPI00216A3B72|nr:MULTISPECIES: YggS family pyridoxal phosphate-dependent enzyme [unclassified Corynebacterium]MCS4490549.1 YggS family pyridoxal phosphate-dependent enzyme [Corynebacterium sp. ES2775-CONJ]MCS4492328.1 YggS family pyridoxal phosphate-dependent enzyme [Corynebacterium sp. ES2715-CONJ3]MCS4532480.1 YggS family pyridoxal phosphate-dependent enzyme [Corynebacterium sp. ES2730-CONJ]MCU9519875.1 YggS family pyridoxal phosphate-dependent enzyme [Corynebacterium sp. ES2794-CONJ1]